MRMRNENKRRILFHCQYANGNTHSVVPLDNFSVKKLKKLIGKQAIEIRHGIYQVRSVNDEGGVVHVTVREIPPATNR